MSIHMNVFVTKKTDLVRNMTGFVENIITNVRNMNVFVKNKTVLSPLRRYFPQIGLFFLFRQECHWLRYGREDGTDVTG